MAKTSPSERLRKLAKSVDEQAQRIPPTCAKEREALHRIADLMRHEAALLEE
jgi:hypothetical protein